MVKARKMKDIIKVKRCPRCSGNLFLEHDKYGYYVVCIQCGANYPVNSLNNQDRLEKVKQAEPVVADAR